MRPFAERVPRVPRFLLLLPLLAAVPDRVDAAGACGQLVRDDFEAGDLAAASWDTRSGELPQRGRLRVSRYAAIEGRFGMAAQFSAEAPARAQSTAPSAEALHRVRVVFDPNGFVPLAGEALTILALVERRSADDGTVRKVASISLGRLEGAPIVYARGMQESGPRLATSAAVLGNGPHVLELEWARSSSPTSADGRVALWVDGILVGAVTDLRNGSLGIEAVRVGAIGPIRAGSGTIYFDEFHWEVGPRAGRFLYSVGGHAFTGAVTTYVIDCASGALTPVSGPAPFVPNQPDSVAIDRAGRHLYVGTLAYNALATYRIDADTGLPSAVPPTRTVHTPSSVVFHSSGRAAYVARWGLESIARFAVDPDTGVLGSTPQAVTDAYWAPYHLVVHPRGHLLYAATQGSGTVSAYRIAADAGLSPIGSFAAGETTRRLAVDPFGRFLYAVNHHTANQSGPGTSAALPWTRPRVR